MKRDKAREAAREFLLEHIPDHLDFALNPSTREMTHRMMADFAEKVALERERAAYRTVAEELGALAYQCCGEPHQYFEEGSEASMGYPVLTEEQCCGNVKQMCSPEMLAYIQQLQQQGG
jgi:hypothetical protein